LPFICRLQDDLLQMPQVGLDRSVNRSRSCRAAADVRV